MLSYATEYKEELNRLGAPGFGRAYFQPVLVVLGMAGDMNDPRSDGGTGVVNVDAVFACGRLTGRVFTVVKPRNSSRGPITVGRTSENDIAIAEYSVSRRHCIIARVETEYRLTDMGSTNGTIVDGVRLAPSKPLRLRGGETISLGRLMLVFYFSEGFIKHLQNL
jgi:Fe2+ transport system protein FeoA